MTEKIRLENGVHLNTRVDGDSGKPWIILSNSLGADHTMWAPQIDALTRNYRVLRYDTRGHGKSDVPEGPYTFDDLVGDVIALMDSMNIDRAAFMGLSMGGMTGLGLSIHHSDRILRVVCADGRADAPDAFRTMWDQRIAAVERGGLEAIADGTLATWFTESWREENPAAVAEIREMITSHDPEGYIACCRALQGLDYLRHLGAARTPILFAGGSQDMGASPETMREMAAATPDGVYREILDAAHVANINNPNGFNAVISDFLGIPSA